MADLIQVDLVTEEGTDTKQEVVHPRSIAMKVLMHLATHAINEEIRLQAALALLEHS